MEDIRKLKEHFSEQGILLSFNGSFTHGIIEEIGNAIKRHLQGEQLKKGVVTDVFSVYLEQTQNVRNYLTRKNLTSEPESSAIMVVVNAEGFYTICSGNSVEKQDVPELVARLEQLNSLDKDGLKKLYKAQLRADRDENATGAGLGLIEIARRASGKMEHRIDPGNGHYDFFSFFVKVAGS